MILRDVPRARLVHRAIADLIEHGRAGDASDRRRAGPP